MCQDKLDWDQSLPDALRPEWDKWRQELVKLDKLRIQRCFHPPDAGRIKVVEVHHFSDASLSGYGQCSYLRLGDENGKFYSSLAMAKSRVTPLKPTTVPRLELQAATLSVKIAEVLDRELKYENMQHHFWTDSKVVLGYIKNQTKRFHMYVANRVQQIHTKSKPDQWHYINTRDNPADHASRGLTTGELISSNWFCGPKFLSETEINSEEVEIKVSSEDPEVKSAIVHSVQCKERSTFEDRIARFSNYSKLITAVTVIVRCMLERKQKVSTLEARSFAERCLVKKYGLIMTCLAMRAVHIEVLDDMSTDSLINGLRCFIALRGNVRMIRCDQGTNFVGAKHS